MSQVSPAKTLPDLYVLDSIVKNVRTPYADFLGPKLYSLFMGAYAKVDSSTRRKMEEMLRTWKEPIPGFMDTKPVFPPELIRPIEMALLGARSAALAAHQSSIQGQQQLLRGARQPSAPFRETPTPPQLRPGLAQPGSYGHLSYAVPDGPPPRMPGDQYPGNNNVRFSFPPPCPPHRVSIRSTY